MTMNDWLPIETERAAALLDAHPSYRVIRALPPLDRLDLPMAEGTVRTAVVLDTETTSLDVATGKLIELALCAVQFDGAGRMVSIGPVHDWLEDPGEPLSPEISRLTGLTDANLRGKHIDDAAALALLESASLLIAHNAMFDVAWIERRYPQIAGKPWCCSLREIDWKAHGYEARQLGPLLAEVAGWFNPRHRADADVAALVGLLASTLPSDTTAFEELVLTARLPTTRIAATGAPFEVKDILKARGYRWNVPQRVWTIDVPQYRVETERDWLAEHAQCPEPVLTSITWHRRHR